MKRVRRFVGAAPAESDTFKNEKEEKVKFGCFW